MRMYALSLSVYAIRNRQKGSIAAFIGLIILSIPNMHIFLIGWPPIGIFPSSYALFTLFIIFSIGSQIREQNRLLKTTTIQSHRLETELLKKSIQPHFLMNTLLSIISWIRMNTEKAVELILILADEYRIINRISSEKTILIKEEIQLCKSHLEIMGYRNNTRYTLITKGISGNERVPPMIFHTLIENGLTHAYRTGESGTFYLKCIKNNGIIHYLLRNDGSKLRRFSQQNQTQIEEGIGLKYIKARLEENVPSNWNVEYGYKDGFWEVNIIIGG